MLPDQEGVANAPTDLPLQKEAAGTLEDRSGPAPPPVELAETPVAPDEMETPQIHEEEAARREPHVQVEPLYWRHHP